MATGQTRVEDRAVDADTLAAANPKQTANRHERLSHADRVPEGVDELEARPVAAPAISVVERTGGSRESALILITVPPQPTCYRKAL